MSLSVEDIRDIIEAFIPRDFPKTYPLDVAALVQRKGFELQYIGDNQESDNISGAIDYKNRIIYVNSTDNKARQRFTTAHELGHYALHEEFGNIIDYRDPERNYGNTEREQEANTFAAELLMPKDIVLEEAKTHTSLIALMNIFDVSKDAMAYRIRNLMNEENQ